MRYSWFTLASLLVVSAASGQSPPSPQMPPAAFDPVNNRLDQLLLRWEREMTAVQSLDVRLTRVTNDKVFGAREIMDGSAKYKRPNLALLYLSNRNNPQVYEKFLCTGNFVYQFDPQAKTVHVKELPKPKAGQMADDNLLSFMFGMKAEEAKRRYDLQIEKEDQYYVYLRVLPRFPIDKADFSWARLVLNRQTFLPRQLYFMQANGNDITWDIPQIVNGARLNPADFTPPSLPAGWTMKKAPPETISGDVPPRVVRPKP
jgi:TIGR03009 family protein